MSGEELLPHQRRGGRVRGAEGYHKEDVLALLKCVRNVVPTTTEEWDQVLDEYRQTHATPNTRAQRDTHSIKVKFKQLARLYKRDIVTRPEIQEAGEILDLIESKMANGNWLQRRGGRTKGAEGFSPEDAQAVLGIVRRFLPLYRREWEQAAEEYCSEYAVPNERVPRDGVSLKNKFRSWLKDDTSNMPRAEVMEALTVQNEIDVKMKQIAKRTASEDRGVVDDVDERGELKLGDHGTVGDVDERRGDENEVIIKKMTNGQSTTSSEGGDKSPVPEPKKRGRTLGSEGYTKTDVQALLACVKEVLPVVQSDWEYVWQLYGANYTTPNQRAPRSATGVKIKFRQLVNWKQGVAKVVPDIIVEARAIERSIQMIERTGKRPPSESEPNVPFSHALETRTLDSREKRSLLLPRSEIRNSDNLERQHVTTSAAGWSAIPQASIAEPAIKRQRQDVSVMKAPNDLKAMRYELKSPVVSWNY